MKRKSILKALLLTVLMCCLTFALVACGGKHTVTFNYGVDGNGDGEVDVVTVEVGDGSLLEEPTDVPTREGYTFVGWGTDDGMWNFEEDTVTSDLTLTARWSAGDPIDPGTAGTTVYVNYKLGVGAADSASAPARWSGAPGTTIKLPDAPAADTGWEFTGWLVEKETEPRAAASDYTVTGTVTITAQWKSVAYTQYTWTIESGNEPGESKTGVATGKPVGGGEPITVELPAFPADESGYADVPTAGKYNVETADATCTENATETLYYTIPQKQTQTQTYESYYLKIREDSLDEPAKGHLYTTWIVTNPSATAAGTATATCANNCGKTLTITLPEITGNTGSGEGKYTEKAVQQQLSCEQDGIVDYVYTIPASDLADGDAEDAAEGTVKELSFTVTTPATGHKIEIEVQFSDATETDTVTKASLIARCRNAGCDKGWDEDANPANATVTFNLGSGNIQSGGVTLAEEDVTFNPETEQFTVTLPGDGAMNLTAGTVFAGWTVGETNYAAGETISVAADGTAAVTGRFVQHTHNYTVDFVPSGENAGKFVATCSADGCPESTVVVATTDGTFNPVLKDGTSVAIGHALSADDFTVEVVYKYQIDWEGQESGKIYKTITPETEGYQRYFSNNLDTVSTEAWASGKQAIFEFKVDSKTIASGTATFDVVPAADDIFGAETDVQILYNKAGDASDLAVPALDNVSTTSGIAFSFWLDSEEINDWNAVVVQVASGGNMITLPNLGSTAGNVWPGADEFKNNAVYSMYLYNNCFVTVSINVSGGQVESVVFYRNGVEVINYAGTTTKEKGVTVRTIAEAILSQIASDGFTFAGGNQYSDLAASNLLVTTQLGKTAAKAVYDWYEPKYMTSDAALRQTVETTLGEDVTIYTVDADAASAAVYTAGTFKDLEKNGLTIMFYIPENGSMVENVDTKQPAASDWAPVITSNGYTVGDGCLDAYSGTGTLKGWNRFETAATQGPAASATAWETFAYGGCTITVTITKTEGILMYKNGDLAFTHAAGGNGSSGTGTVETFIAELFSALETSGGRVAGATATNTYLWAEDLVVTSALAENQVKALYNAVHPAS